MNMKYCKQLLLLLTMTFCVVATAMGADKKFTLVLDAGHGGKDTGCKSSTLQEKDINLRATLMLGELIKANCPDVNVIFTRQTDVFIPLHQRADIANKAKADLFISLHTNAGSTTSSTAKGFETWTMGIRRSDEKLSAAKRENDVILIESDYKEHYAGYDPNSPESDIMFEFMLEKNMDKSVELARYIQDRVCHGYGRINRGVRQDVFLVLRETSMPACLVELGFITCAEEHELMANDSTLAPTIQGIYEAFVQYKNKYDLGAAPLKIVKPAVAEKTEPSTKTEQVAAVAEPKQPEKAEKVDSPVKTESQEPVKKQPSQKSATTPTYIYKVQILAVNRTLRSDSEQLKGHKEAESFRDGNMVKYTIGVTSSYDEAAKLRKKLASDFPNAFVIAFKDGVKMSANDARQEQKQKK